MPSPNELSVAIATYENLIANYERARERLLDRRQLSRNGGATQLDEHLAANQRTIDTLRRAVEFSREQLRVAQCEPRQSETQQPAYGLP